MKPNNRLLKRLPGRLGAAALIIVMVFCMMPGVSLWAGPITAYADEIGIEGYVKASDLQNVGDYFLTGDTTIDIDTDKVIGSLNIGSYSLQIDGTADNILSIWGSGIKGSSGSLYLMGGHLEVDSSAPAELHYPAAINIPDGTVQFDGGNLFINYYNDSSDASEAYGVNSKNFIVNSGTATITCTSVSESNATGIQCKNFEMLGGSVGVDGETIWSNKVGKGIAAAGSGSDSDFYMAGGDLRSEGKAGGIEGYGIDWTASSDNSLIIEGGTLEAVGDRAGIRAWCNVLFNAGAQAKVRAPGGYGIDIYGGSLTVQGIGTKLTVSTGSGTAVVVSYDNDINLLEGAAILDPEGGEIKDMGTHKTIVDTEGITAHNVEIESKAIPTELAITYDVSMAFPTTRLSGKEVTMYLMKSITSNPGYPNASDGWYIEGGDPGKTDTNTYRWTCLVKKVDGQYVELYNSEEPLDPSGEYYFRFNIENDVTGVFDTTKTYTATVNGEPADEVIQPGDWDGDIYVYRRVYLDETTDVIWSVSVTPQDSIAARGGNRQFTAEIYGATDDALIWSVSDNNSSGTYIDSNGKLFVAADETADEIRVTATSAIDSTVSDTADVYVSDEEPYIERVTVTEMQGKTIVCRGTVAQFEASVEGTDIQDLTWELIGSDGSSTLKKYNNLHADLEVAEEETASSLTIRVTSVADPTKYGEATITLKDKVIITGPINITYDASAVKLTDCKTGKQVTEEFRAAITSPKGEEVSGVEAPGGWYVYFGGDSRWTSLVRSDGYGGFDQNLYKSEELLSADEEYYLWFNLEQLSSTHKFDKSMDISELNITVNGKPVDGDNIIADWGQPLEVYVRVYFDGQEPEFHSVRAVIWDVTNGRAVSPSYGISLARDDMSIGETDHTWTLAEGKTFDLNINGLPSGWTWKGWTVGSPGSDVVPGTDSDSRLSVTVGDSDAVYYALVEAPEDASLIDRIAGPNRYQTAFAAADKLKAEMGFVVFPNMVIASGMDFPDALAGAYLAVEKNAPVLLTNAGTAPIVAEYVKNNMASGGTVYILGGVGAVPAAMETALEARGITNIKRLAGANRYDTNKLILEEAGVSGKDILVCSGKDYADSLSASATGLPILLVTDALLPVQKEYLDSIKGTVSGNFYAIGGVGAVSDRVFNEVKEYAAGSTDRIAGPNRYATSVAIADKFFPWVLESVVVAYAQDYPDGLAGGPVACSIGSPLLLVTNSAYAPAKDYVKTTAASKIKVMGGTAMISDATALKIILRD